MTVNSNPSAASGDSGSRGRDTTITTGNKPPEFTNEQKQLYQKRYDEGYNLTVDSEYLRWLKFHHPESSLLCGSPSASGDSGSRGRGTTVTTGSKPPEFTDEQEQLYQKRYVEGYNLTVDSEYLRWLKFHYPESSLLCGFLSESNEEEMSLSAYFSDIDPSSTEQFIADQQQEFIVEPQEQLSQIGIYM